MAGILEIALVTGAAAGLGATGTSCSEAEAETDDGIDHRVTLFDWVAKDVLGIKELVELSDGAFQQAVNVFHGVCLSIGSNERVIVFWCHRGFDASQAFGRISATRNVF